MQRLRWDAGRNQSGQTTAEYALVLLAAAAIAFLLITWAQQDTGSLKEFFTSIIQNIQNDFVGGGGN